MVMCHSVLMSFCLLFSLRVASQHVRRNVPLCFRVLFLLLYVCKSSNIVVESPYYFSCVTMSEKVCFRNKTTMNGFKRLTQTMYKISVNVEINWKCFGLNKKVMFSNSLNLCLTWGLHNFVFLDFSPNLIKITRAVGENYIFVYSNWSIIKI